MGSVQPGEVTHYDRSKELKAFDETKTGVKGIVDLGIEKIPRIFVRTQDEFTEDLAYTDAGISIESRRNEIIDEIGRASMTWGFFQLVNHGIPISVTNEMIQGIRRFHEGDVEVKRKLYVKDLGQKVQYDSNFDLYKSRSATWRDTFRCRLDIIVEYWKHIMHLGDTLAELLSEALGLHKDHLKGMDCTQYLTLLGHYYPACPEPELTMGTTKHSDQSFFTILLQDQVAGLQFLHENHWVTVKPIPGALTVNIGDLIQEILSLASGNIYLGFTDLISNDKFKSSEHRVVASHVGPRVSVGCFYRASLDKPTLRYPIRELISESNPPVYKDITFKEYINYVHSRGLDGVSSLNYFKL
ncbi:hypothetical protein MKW98_031515 [Papaver atlanticum]|uniref:Fe2OG dioxygenase domain-containing protein n=1 Tax=Papaver atlanticum TaxID=357466 RepID=A0AAD4S586_9MAGN|nr:hypothetical protein MKW98_031515 [Papaver atlanticum]